MDPPVFAPVIWFMTVSSEIQRLLESANDGHWSVMLSIASHPTAQVQRGKPRGAAIQRMLSHFQAPCSAVVQRLGVVIHVMNLVPKARSPKSFLSMIRVSKVGDLSQLHPRV